MDMAFCYIALWNIIALGGGKKPHLFIVWITLPY
jgi:hypothetical protein